jgi:uncharacterized RDD family membrane protein YckC
MDPNESPTTTTQQSPAHDPYAPPSAQVAAPVYATGAQAPLADRGSRFVAQLLDGLVSVPAILLIGLGAGFGEQQQSDLSGIAIICVVLGIIYFIALLVINLRLLGREGQTLGKKWAKVRIVRTDGSPASLGRIVGLRYIVNGIPGAIPVVGGIYSLVDILFIFRDDRRCIHDMIADTKVVAA